MHKKDYMQHKTSVSVWNILWLVTIQPFKHIIQVVLFLACNFFQGFIQSGGVKHSHY